MVVIPVGEEDLALAVAGAAAGPGQLFAVGRKHRQAVEAVAGGDAHRRMLAGGVDEVQLEVGKAVEVGGEDQVLAAGVEVRRPAHGAQPGDLARLAAVGVHGPDFGNISLGREAAPADALAVGAEKRPAVVAGRIGEALDVRAVGVGNVQVHEVLLVDLQAFGVLLGHRAGIGSAIAGKDDLAAVRRVGAFGVVAAFAGEVAQRLVGQGVLPDVVVLVVIPGVLAHPAGLPVLVLGGLQRLRLRIAVRAGEQHALAVGMHPGAGGLAEPGRKPLLVARFQVHQVDLVEGVARLAFGLEHHLRAVGAEVALAGAAAFEGELADAGEEIRFRLSPDGGGQEKQGGQAHGEAENIRTPDRLAVKRCGRKEAQTARGPVQRRSSRRTRATAAQPTSRPRPMDGGRSLGQWAAT